MSVYTIWNDSVIGYVVARPCKARERVYMKLKPDNYDFTYMYEYLFKGMILHFP